MPIDNKEDYLKSLEGRKLKVFIHGEAVENPAEHPIVKPSVNSVAETYELAITHPELALVDSPIAEKKINRFLHISVGSDDLVAQNKMQRKLGQITGTCFQRCVGMDAFNSLYLL